MGNILEEIAAQRRLDVAAAKQVTSAEQLRKKIESTESVYGPPLPVLERLNAPAVRQFDTERIRAVFTDYHAVYCVIALTQKEGWLNVALAAEFKRASPSKGDIAMALDLRGAWKMLLLHDSEMEANVISAFCRTCQGIR